MKLVYSVVAALLIGLIATFVFAGWQTSIETNFTGTTYTWTNGTGGMLWINAVLVRHAAAVSNNITLYRLDSDLEQYNVGTTGVDASLLDAMFTAPGNGQIAVPKYEGLRIVQTATNQLFVVFDLEEPE